MKKTILRASSLFTAQLFLALCLFPLITNHDSVAQTDTSFHHPVTDQEKIADALRAGPRFITDNATILDWPSTSGGEYRVIRKGTNEWTCLPGVPGYPHDEPGCFDATFMRWMKDSLAGRAPHIDKIGIAYMYVGAWVPNQSHNGAGEDFRVGPHIMIVSPHQYQDELRPLNHDGSNAMPYVAHLPHGTDLYLVLPFRQWDEPVSDQSQH